MFSRLLAKQPFSKEDYNRKANAIKLLNLQFKELQDNTAFAKYIEALKQHRSNELERLVNVSKDDLIYSQEYIRALDFIISKVFKDLDNVASNIKEM